jgi:RNA polymerase sigma-70 factor (ECF subfamily)
MYMVSAAVLQRWTALADEEIVTRVIDGETALFEVLMRRHNERVYRAARAIVRDEAEAEDVMQQTYVNAYGSLRQFDRRAQFSTWLTRIAVNEALARVRKRGRFDTMDDEPSADERSLTMPVAPDPEQHAFAGELRNLLESAIDRLPDGCREVFMLRQVDGMSTADTASCLGVSEDVVKTRLSRAKVALRRDLSDRAGLATADTFRFPQPRCNRVVAAVMARIA